ARGNHHCSQSRSQNFPDRASVPADIVLPPPLRVEAMCPKTTRDKDTQKRVAGVELARRSATASNSGTQKLATGIWVPICQGPPGGASCLRVVESRGPEPTPLGPTHRRDTENSSSFQIIHCSVQGFSTRGVGERLNLREARS